MQNSVRIIVNQNIYSETSQEFQHDEQLEDEDFTDDLDLDTSKESPTSFVCDQGSFTPSNDSEDEDSDDWI